MQARLVRLERLAGWLAGQRRLVRDEITRISNKNDNASQRTPDSRTTGRYEEVCLEVRLIPTYLLVPNSLCGYYTTLGEGS